MELQMNARQTFGRALVAVCALVALNSMAASHMGGEMKAGDMMKMEMMDKNKDGKVTRAEFVDMMGKMYDMKAKSMGVKGGGLDAAQLEAMRLWMYSQ
jgi:EF hand